MQTVDPAMNKINKENENDNNNNDNDNVPKAIAINQPIPIVQDDMLRTPLINDPNKVIMVQNGTTITPTPITILPKHPITMICPCCNKQIQTRINQTVGLGTYCASAAMCVICCPLFWIPCVIKECKDVVHYCPNCGTMIGTKELI